MTYVKNHNWSVRPSRIHGIGVFAERDYHKGEFVDIGITFIASIMPSVTYFGSKINHSRRPNLVLEKSPDGSTWDLYATDYITAGTEFTVDYNNTPWYIMKPDPNW